MKMILAIVSHDDANTVSTELMKKHFQVTKLATTGGFLKTGNTTMLVGTDDEKVDSAIAIIKQFSKKREEIIPSSSDLSTGLFSMPIAVAVGGATIFVLDVDRFEKA